MPTPQKKDLKYESRCTSNVHPGKYSVDAFYYGNEMPTKAVIEVYNEVNGDPIHTQNVNIN